MDESRTAVGAGLLGNAALAALKGVSAAATGSAAMVADGCVKVVLRPA